jgi:hypothetical protein
MEEMTHTPHVAFATGRSWARLTTEDRLVAGYLRGHGVQVTAACWDDGTVDWRAFDAWAPARFRRALLAAMER